jgi:hypothetical protein
VQCGKSFPAPCAEAGLRAIRKERFRLFCAEHYYEDASEIDEATGSIITILDCLARLFDDHIQLKLVCVLFRQKFSLFVCLLGLSPAKATVGDGCQTDAGSGV